MTKTIMSSSLCCPLSATVRGSLESEWLPEFHTYPLNHIFWLGAYSTHLLEVSHFQHYILILVSGAYQEKLRLGSFRPWETSADGCKLLVQRARTSSSFKKFIVSFSNVIQNTFSNLGLMSLQYFVPTALIRSVINCSNMVSVCVPVVHERHKNNTFDWQNDCDERVSVQRSCSSHITYK